MKRNVTYSVGNLALIDKVDAEFGYFEYLFKGIGGKAKNLKNSMKLFIYNRLGDCFPTNLLPEVYAGELFEELGFTKKPSGRSCNREVERLGKNYAFLLERHQQFLKEHGLVTDKQYMDFSSSYFEGKSAALGERGYSRDGKPGKKQITFGVATGINSIPTALTIQKGNVQDKKHFRFMLKTAGAVLEENSLVIFDCGANTKENKRLIREKGFHYLTLKPKKRGPYKKAIAAFNASEKQRFTLNGRPYQCVKLTKDEETWYVFFSEKLQLDQLATKNRKWQRVLEKNRRLLKKTRKGKPLAEYPSEEGTIIAKGSLQTVLDYVPNQYITGLEGFFILESSVDTQPELLLALYKDKDKAEKLIRNMKEGTELRPFHHWTTDAIIGCVVIAFLTNFLVNLTLLRAKDTVVRNTKRLKKYLTQLTLTVVYPPTGFRFHILANICPEITAILGDFIHKYEDKSLHLRW